MISKPYVCDFGYINRDLGYILTIEIDEPYELNSLKAIHSNDEKRNNFFLQLNCPIIRIAEEQAVKQPNQVCEFLNSIICNFEKMQWNQIDSEVIPIKKWSSYESEILAKTKYRSTYLDIIKSDFTL